MKRSVRNTIIIITSVVLVIALCVVGVFLYNRDIMASSEHRYIAYIDSFDDTSATYKGITDVNLMVLKVSSDGSISSAVPGKTVDQVMAAAKQFKLDHPKLRVNLCVLGIAGWESYVESSAYVSRINSFANKLISLTHTAGLDGIDLYVGGPTSVNFANMCKAVKNLLDAKTTAAGEKYTLSVSVGSDGNSLELTSCGTLNSYVDYFNVCCFDYGTQATGQLMSATLTAYLDYGLSADDMNLILSASEANAELAADISSVAYADGLGGLGVVGYSSDTNVSQMTSIMIYVFENGINIIVRGDMAAFPMYDLGEYDRDMIIAVCTIGDDIIPITLSRFDSEDNNLYYHVMYNEGFFSAYYVNVSFGDIMGTAHCDDIQFCCARGLFDLAGDGFFYPDEAITNREVLAAMCRITGEAYDLDLDVSYLPVTDSSEGGSDATPTPKVDLDAYYEAFVDWAVNKGLITSTDSITTNPDSHATYDNMTKLMSSLADYMGNDDYSPADYELDDNANHNVSRGLAAEIFRDYIESFFN